MSANEAAADTCGMSSGAIKREGYSFQLVNIECLPHSDHFNVVMDLEATIEDLLPYLAASFASCTYVHGTGIINLMDAGHIVAFYPRRITITDVAGREEAEALCRDCMQRIEQVREQKGSICPIYDKRPSTTVLDIFRSLPGTNCGLCPFSTCMAFAAAVFRGEAATSACMALNLR